MEYGSDHAELYDLVFASRGRDPQAEAEGLTSLIRSRFPGAKSLLDVGCGTGAHLETLAAHFEDVEGLEYSLGMRQVAERRLPQLKVHPGDMRTFDLGRTFDAVICMFYAIAEVDSPEELAASVGRMAAHLNPGGVLVLEPWFFPDNFIDGYVGGHMINEPGRVISRMTHSVRQGRKTRMQIKFVIADSSGFREFTDVLLTSLFTREEYEKALRSAGFSAEFLPDFELPGRPHSPGLWLGTRD
jgi:SAM-dependent methyltransferase